jgi:CheY-like chemotaxis protein
MKTILILEPDLLLAKAYVQSLNDVGLEVLTSANAQQAVHSLDEHEISLVLMEVQLPGHNGVEFIYEMRSYPEWREIPIIINTFLNPKNLPKKLIADKKLNIAKVLSKSRLQLSDLVVEIESVLSQQDD